MPPYRDENFEVGNKYLLTSWSRVLEKLTGSQLVKKFPPFYGTRTFIAAFTIGCHQMTNICTVIN